MRHVCYKPDSQTWDNFFSKAGRKALADSRWPWGLHLMMSAFASDPSDCNIVTWLFADPEIAQEFADEFNGTMLLPAAML